MSREKSLVFFGAHPDDESFGVGSTLALYGAAGVKTYVVCSTGGEMGTVEPELLQEKQSVQELRSVELECAARELGLTGLYYLGYRDSGMRGSETNKHPDAMAMAPIEDITGRIVKIMREMKPDVVITHDAGGGYGHPDHVATHNGVVKAFHAAGDPSQYPEAGPAFQPKKLYFNVRSRSTMKMMIRLMPLLGQDPHHFGRNRDIDLTRTLDIEYPIHAVIKLTKEAVEIRTRAAACHNSQFGGRRRGFGIFRMMELIDKVRGPQDTFMRQYPPPSSPRKEKDLFEGID